MSDKKVKVKAYTRSRARRKPDPEDGTGIEIPVVAPQEGAKILKRTGPVGTTDPRTVVNDGVKIIGGGSRKTFEQPSRGVDIVSGG